jgi:hypothetical protein
MTAGESTFDYIVTGAGWIAAAVEAGLPADNDFSTPSIMIGEKASDMILDDARAAS